MVKRSDKPLEDWELPDQADMDNGEVSADLSPCPNCSVPVWEDAEHCPHCGEWITRSGLSPRTSSKPYMRFGYWAARTLVLNWLFWLAMGVLAILVWLTHLVLG